MWHAWEWGETSTGFWWDTPKEKDYLKDQVLDEIMGSKWTLGRLVGGVEWIHLAQDGDFSQGIVNTVVNLLILPPGMLLVHVFNIFCVTL
jgi:hypothetical protein